MQVLKRIVSAMFVGTLLLAAPTVHADEKMDHGQGHARHWDRFEMLKKQLDLTDDQVSQLRDAEQGQGEKAKLLKDKTEADESALAVLVDEKASDADLKAGLRALMADHKAQLERAEKKIETFRNILKPMQQAKLVVMMYGHRHGHGRRGGFDGGWQGQHGPRGGWQGGPQGGMPDGGMHGPDQAGGPDHGSQDMGQ